MPSSLITVLARHCEDATALCPPAEPAGPATPAEALAAVPDPRRVRGRRYRLGALLAPCLVAVLGGARSPAQIARFAADAAPEVRAASGLVRSTPNASTLGRLPAQLDGDALDDAVGARPARHSTDPIGDPAPVLVAPAVDGRTVRGSRTDGAAVHLLAAARRDSRSVIAQREIAARSNEIPAFAPLSARLDLHGVVITADAMHTRRGHAEKITAAGGHYLFIVKGNQKKLCKRLKRPPWDDIPLQDRTTHRGHGRSEVRRPKVCTVQPGLLFPHAVQARSGRRPSTPSPVCPRSRPALPTWPNSFKATGPWKLCTTRET
ncbi:ISAs1 family transposase [Kitasatospora sp. NPDC058063]|uniref:ISAs1 family transposase n=1 Tax=unclassified Kitasatospora TaxID=2633591 RepID=UPI0036D9906C